MAMTGLIVAESSDGVLHPQCMELLAAARVMGASRIVVLVAGYKLERLVQESGQLPVDEVLVLDSQLLESYTTDGFVRVLASAVSDLQPGCVLFPSTYRSRELAPSLATRFGRSVINDCIEIHPYDNDFVRQVFQGRALCRVHHRGEAPVFLIPLPGAFTTDDLLSPSARKPTISRREIQLTPEQIRTRPFRQTRSTGNLVDLERAEIIIGVGRGIGCAEHMKLINRLAVLLGAELAATRPVCDEQWLPIQRQVGSSGQTVSPRLYLAIGISGATQHAVGIQGAGLIVAINKDPHAPIFKIADIGIVGDLFEIVPALIEQLESRGS